MSGQGDEVGGRCEDEDGREADLNRHQDGQDRADNREAAVDAPGPGQVLWLLFVEITQSEGEGHAEAESQRSDEESSQNCFKGKRQGTTAFHDKGGGDRISDNEQCDAADEAPDHSGAGRQLARCQASQSGEGQ